ncbi:hypothetical protein NUW58_g1076 [Xylaria curta]|uniref:Uncharacterized protein n=1 Tax=Xylaria curta TaxID=42375 RepID=A0ACC1PNF4_9PEZI|nr:hypothetical protein NUW58_g1076 [Xylaria curta]
MNIPRKEQGIPEIDIQYASVTRYGSGRFGFTLVASRYIEQRPLIRFFGWKTGLGLKLRTKFNVAYDDLEKLKAGHVTELPAQVGADLFSAGDMYRKLLAAVHLLMENGAFDIKDGTDAKEVFPGIKPKTVGSLLEEAWKKA